ncbi:hypothetical protein ACROYT_G012667 [Oculina patagonica]
MTKYIFTGTWALIVHSTADSSRVSRQHSLACSVARSKRAQTKPSSKSCSVTWQCPCPMSPVNDSGNQSRMALVTLPFVS